ncbi:hypothetical protein HZB94_00600 [Candidatus Falkowbacteria bacterium]|nr:hypothetical protein [Candidatus Falkowbacteria bacterium]
MPNTIYDNLSDDELKAGYWYVTHRVLLRKIFVFSLAIVSGGLLLYGVWGLINFYLAESANRQALEADIAKSKLNYQLLAEINKPLDLQIMKTEIIKGGGGAHDIVTSVVNPNSQWAVESLDYYYLIGDEKTNVKTEYILPGQSKLILYLNYDDGAGISSAQLMMENIKWKKVADFSAWQEKVMQFGFENQVALSSKKSGLSEQEMISTIQFDVLNRSPYSFLEPRFIVLIGKADKIVGVTQTVLPGLSSGERRTETVNLFQSISGGAELQIIPDINILDPSVFKGGSGSSGELK